MKKNSSKTGHESRPDGAHAPSQAPQPDGLGGAERWKQIQDLLLGDHQRAVEARFQATGEQLRDESSRLVGLLEALETRHQELSQALQAEVRERRELAEEVSRLRKASVARKDLAARLRKWADKLSPDEA